MLVNLPEDWDASPENPYAQTLEDFEYGWDQFALGQYHALPDFAFEHLVEDEYPFQGNLRAHSGDDEWLGSIVQEMLRQEREDAPQDFGVCDRPRQVVERWPQLESDPRPFIINFRRVDRFAQPAKDGWRWHKHGKYIGMRDPKHEYLADEPEIESVWTFHIYQIRGAS